MTISPILMKELRSRMRDKKTPLWTTSILFLTAIVIVLVMYTSDAINKNGRDLSEIGTITFYIITGALFLFCSLTSATVSSASFSIEREQETLEMLLLTRMSALQMVMGKIYGSMAFILYLVVLFIPVAAVSFIFGGISPTQLILIFIIILTSSFCYCAMGTFASLIQKKSNGAVVMSYLIILYFLIGFPIMLAIPIDELSSFSIGMFFSFIFLYLPFALFLMELILAYRLLKANWIGKLGVGLLFCLTIIGLQVGFGGSLSSNNLEAYILALNPVSFGVYIFNGQVFSTSYSILFMLITYFVFISLLSAAFIKMAAARVNFMRRGIGLH